MNWWNCTVSFIFFLLTQFCIYLVPHFFSHFPFFSQLALSALVLLASLGFGRWCRRILGLHSSAPAFVLFNIIYIWAVYICVASQAMYWPVDAMFTAQVVLLIVGLSRMLFSDPGRVTCVSPSSEKMTESSSLEMEAYVEGCNPGQRVRYCRSCKAYVQGFDHHCPAFGNCIGQKNRVLFMVSLIGFIVTEVSYIVCASQFATKFNIFIKSRSENGFARNLAASTMLFSVLQLVWQVNFLTWHLYCACFNIRTDEWINWKKYPEFHILVQPLQTGESSEIRFRNPYDKGILRNLKVFITQEE